MKRSRLIIFELVAALLIAGIGLTAAVFRSNVSTAEDDIPFAHVKLGELDLKVYTTGELKANHSVTLSAPPIGGGSLQITNLLHTGTRVKKGDVVIEFDPSEQIYKLEQSRSELEQAEQDIIKAKNDAAVQAAQDQVALLKARFDVRRSELEVQKNELVSSIDAQKNKLALDQGTRALAQLEQDIQSHGITGTTGIDLAREKWNKAKLSMEQAQQNIQRMHVVSPIEGLVAIQKNVGDFAFSGMSIPDYHEGDQAQPGSAIAQVVDSHDMEISAKVSETERANVTVGQAAEIEFDAIAGKVFHGVLKSAAGMVQRNFFWEGQGSKYDITIQLDDSDATLRPGMTAQVVILGEKKSKILYVPRQALFQKEGTQTVFLKNGASFKQLPVKVTAENESRAAIEGLKEEDAVALVDPTAPSKSPPSGATATLGGGTP